jgi:hypothetical protein
MIRSAARERRADIRERHWRHQKVTSFLDLMKIAAARGEGLDPKLRALFEGTASSGIVPRNDGMSQSGPDPRTERFGHAQNVSVLPLRGTQRAIDDAT